MSVALPPPEDRSFADVWSALGGELKPSLDLVISVPVTESPVYAAGPPVGEDGLRLGFSEGVPPPGAAQERPPARMPSGAELPVYGGRPGATAPAAKEAAEPSAPREPRRSGIASRVAEDR
jgi:hypothetical protein